MHYRKIKQNCTAICLIIFYSARTEGHCSYISIHVYLYIKNNNCFTDLFYTLERYMYIFIGAVHYLDIYNQ